MDKKILIISGAGGHNLGDDAQLFNNVRILKLLGYKNLKIMTPQPYLGELCQTETTNSFWDLFSSEKKNNPELLTKQALQLYLNVLNHQIDSPLVKEIEQCDILFGSGSGTINTRHLQSLLVALMPIMIACALNKRVILSGQGVTPMNNYFLTPLITYTLNKVERIVLRDFKMGSKSLQNINVLKSKIMIGCDDAFTTPRTQGGLPEIPKNSVAINISHYMTEDLQKTIYEFCQSIKKKGYNPIFNYFQDEQKLVTNLAEQEFQTVHIKHPSEGAWFFSQVIGTVGMRYHSFIFSVAGLTPVVNIYTNEYQKLKIQAIKERYEMPSCMIALENVTVSSLEDQFQSALLNQPGYLLKMKEEWIKVSNTGARLVAKND